MGTSCQPRGFVRSNENEAWQRALANLHEADAHFETIRKVFNAAESAYFALRRKKGGDSHDLDDTPEKRSLDKATADEATYGNALNEAANLVYGTPSPDLAALITKFETVRSLGYEGDSETMILADLRQLHARLLYDS